MLKKIINDDNKIFLNIFIFAILFMFLFLIMFFPIVFIAILSNPNTLDVAYSEINGNISEFYKTIDSMSTVIEFLIAGTIAEFIRRKKSLKFKMFDKTALIFYYYATFFESAYIIISIIKIFFKI